MSVKALYALQNGLLGFEKSGLFYGERSAERVQIPVTCYLVMAADTIAGYIQGLLDGVEFQQTSYALDRSSRRTALVQFLCRAKGESDNDVADELAALRSRSGH